MYQMFFDTISTLADLNEGERNALQQAFCQIQVPKKHVLCREGEVAREVFFINQGLLRLYYSNEGEDITAFLFQEGLFASCHESFLRQAPSLQTLETLEPTALLVIRKEDWDRLHEELPVLNVITRKIAEQRFVNMQQILSSFLLDSPEERYVRFEKSNRSLLQRVPQHYIASFLGMTPVSLSRIRKRLMDKRDLNKR